MTCLITTKIEHPLRTWGTKGNRSFHNDKENEFKMCKGNFGNRTTTKPLRIWKNWNRAILFNIFAYIFFEFPFQGLKLSRDPCCLSISHFCSKWTDIWYRLNYGMKAKTNSTERVVITKYCSPTKITILSILSTTWILLYFFAINPINRHC